MGEPAEVVSAWSNGEIRGETLVARLAGLFVQLSRWWPIASFWAGKDYYMGMDRTESPLCTILYVTEVYLQLSLNITSLLGRNHESDTEWI